METLTKLFGTAAKVKLMRLFLFNEDQAFTASEIAEKTRSKSTEVRKELSLLMNIGLVRKKSITREVHYKKRKKITVKKVSDTGYHLDKKFPYLHALKNLLTTVSLHADDTLVRRFQPVGRVKFFVVAGLFIQNWDSRVDLLIVGDDLNLSKLDAVIKTIESEIGKEIVYSAFETPDFEYRYGMHDRLIRDILDAPHLKLVNKIEDIA